MGVSTTFHRVPRFTFITQTRPFVETTHSALRARTWSALATARMRVELSQRSTAHAPTPTAARARVRVPVVRVFTLAPRPPALLRSNPRTLALARTRGGVERLLRSARGFVFDAFIRARGVVPRRDFAPLLRLQVYHAQLDEFTAARRFGGAPPFERIDERVGARTAVKLNVEGVVAERFTVRGHRGDVWSTAHVFEVDGRRVEYLSGQK